MGITSVLVVDDEPQLLHLTEGFLVRHGYQVVTCSSPEEAYRRFKQDAGAYTVAVIDLTLPVMSGKELAAKLLDLNPQLKLILCSGYPFDPSQIPAAPREQILFLQKPFLPRMLTECIQRLVGGIAAAETA